MSKFLSKRLRSFKPYRLVTPESFRREVLGEKIYKLDWNEGFYNYGGDIKLNRYSNPNLKFYEEKVLEIYNENLYNVRLFPGSDIAHIEILRLYADVGDKCTIFGPTYDNFRCTAESFGLEIDYVLSKWDINQFKNILINNDSKLVYICNPNNPTGEYFSEIDDLITSFPEILFLVDEAYLEFTESKFLSKKTCLDNVVFFRTFSKAFSLAGVRLGVILASEKLFEDIDLIYNPKHLSSTALSSIDMVITNKLKIKDYIDKVIFNRNELQYKITVELNDDVNCSNSSGNFLLLHINNKQKRNSLKNNLQDLNIFVREFTNFHGLNAIRITITDDISISNLIFKTLKDIF